MVLGSKGIPPNLNVIKMTNKTNYMVYCDNCEETTKHKLSIWKDTETKEKYTDLVCNDCASITACFDGEIEINRLDGT